MHGAAYAQSAKIARDHGGPFAGYEKNREPFLRVMRKHRAALKDIDKTHVPKDLLRGGQERVGRGHRAGRAARLPQRAGDRARADRHHRLHDGLRHDRRRAGHRAGEVQEAGRRRDDEDRQPDRADGAARSSATPPQQVKEIIEYIDENETIEGAPHIKEQAPAGVRLRVQAGARRALDPLHGPHPDDGRGAAVPLGRDLKTVNVPKDATVEEIQQAYIESWRHGRQGGVDLPRRLQADAAAEHVARQGEGGGGGRRSGSDAGASCRTSATRSPTSSTSPATRATSPSASTRTARPARSSSSWRRKARRSPGFADAFAQAISYALQYGVPLQDLVDKFSHVRFEPSGMTKNPDVRFAKSIVDYIFRWMAAKFLSPEAQFRAGVNNREELVDDAGAAAARRRRGRGRRRRPAAIASPTTSSFAAIQNQEDAPPCSTCGSIMVRSARATSARTAARRAAARSACVTLVGAGLPPSLKLRRTAEALA